LWSKVGTARTSSVGTIPHLVSRTCSVGASDEILGEERPSAIVWPGLARSESERGLSFPDSDGPLTASRMPRERSSGVRQHPHRRSKSNFAYGGCSTPRPFLAEGEDQVPWVGAGRRQSSAQGPAQIPPIHLRARRLARLPVIGREAGETGEAYSAASRIEQKRGRLGCSRIVPQRAGPSCQAWQSRTRAVCKQAEGPRRGGSR